MGTISEKSSPGQREQRQRQMILSWQISIMRWRTTAPRYLQLMLSKMEMKKVWDSSRIVIPFDHIAPANNETSATLQKEIREWVREQGIPNFYEMGKESAIRYFLRTDSHCQGNWLWEPIRIHAPMGHSGLCNRRGSYGHG